MDVELMPAGAFRRLGSEWSDLPAPWRGLAGALADAAATGPLGWPDWLERVVVDLAAGHPAFSWTGVYLLDGEELVLGPYDGAPTEHVRIRVGQGICGAAAAQGQTVVVDDVRQDERYLACFLSTRSEIVVPIFGGGDRVIGEIDVDSDDAAAFSDVDRRFLEAVAAELGRIAPEDPLRGVALAAAAGAR